MEGSIERTIERSSGLSLMCTHIQKLKDAKYEKDMKLETLTFGKQTRILCTRSWAVGGTWQWPSNTQTIASASLQDSIWCEHPLVLST